MLNPEDSGLKAARNQWTGRETKFCDLREVCEMEDTCFVVRAVKAPWYEYALGKTARSAHQLDRRR